MMKNTFWLLALSTGVGGWGCRDNRPQPPAPPPVVRHTSGAKLVVRPGDYWVRTQSGGEIISFGALVRFQFFDKYEVESRQNNFGAQIWVIPGPYNDNSGRDVFSCNTDAGVICGDQDQPMGFIDGVRSMGWRQPQSFDLVGANGRVEFNISSSRVKDDGTLYSEYNSMDTLYPVIIILVVDRGGGELVFSGATWMSPKLRLSCYQMINCEKLDPLGPEDAEHLYHLYVDPPAPRPSFVVPPQPLPLNCPCAPLSYDGDDDTINDCDDGCPYDSDKVSPGACGCGAVDFDSDGDDVADCVDSCPLNPDIATGFCPPWCDGDRDGDCDLNDFGLLQRCLDPYSPYSPDDLVCRAWDAFPRDGWVTPEEEGAKFASCYSGPDIPATCP